MEKLFVQYGCGLSAPKEWVNFDSSPTLRIQKTPVLSSLLQGQLNVRFPDSVKYGDIVEGLPIADNSVDALYCSHVLEHLALEDFRKALRNSYKVLRKGGIFRCILPDLEYAAREYLKALDAGDDKASLEFMGPATLLGLPKRPKGVKGMAATYFGNSLHLWMWDRKSLTLELLEVGFESVRPCQFGDSTEKAYSFVEDEGRFTNALALECRK